uniref:Uncharacterized protein n=1 Tax=Setaria italica TaxID=4555 RepID=K3YKG7_SETIT
MFRCNAIPKQEISCPFLSERVQVRLSIQEGGRAEFHIVNNDVETNIKFSINETMRCLKQEPLTRSMIGFHNPTQIFEYSTGATTAELYETSWS